MRCRFQMIYSFSSIRIDFSPIAYLLSVMPGSQASLSVSAISAELIDTINVRSLLRWGCFTFFWLGKMTCFDFEMSFSQAYQMAELPLNQDSDTSVYRMMEVDSPTRGVFRSKEAASESPLILLESNPGEQELLGTHTLDSEAVKAPFAKEEKIEQK